MNITPITSEEFPLTDAPGARKEHGQKISPFTKAVRALAIGEGFSMPCEWPHTPKRNGCMGTTKANVAVRPYQTLGFGTMRLKTKCIGGTFYVLRLDDKEALP